MSKRKTNEIKNICGKKLGQKNHVPKEICSVVEKLQRLDFIKHIQLRDFRNSNNGSGIRIIGYDEKSRNYSVNVNTGRYEQKILLGVSEKNGSYENLIKMCL